MGGAGGRVGEDGGPVPVPDPVPVEGVGAGPRPSADPGRIADRERVADAELDALFREQWWDLVRLATFLTGSQVTAEDLVQDVFARFATTRPDPDHPAAYLRTSVVNACRSHHRRRFRERRNPPDPAGHDHSDRPDELWDVLARLPGRQRAALVLRYYLDLPEGEIANQLRCRPSTVRTLVRRGLAAARRELSP